MSLSCMQHRNIGISLAKGQLSHICNHSYYNYIFRWLAQFAYQSCVTCVVFVFLFYSILVYVFIIVGATFESAGSLLQNQPAV
jgi:hypothetical protein